MILEFIEDIADPSIHDIRVSHKQIREGTQNRLLNRNIFCLLQNREDQARVALSMVSRGSHEFHQTVDGGALDIRGPLAGLDKDRLCESRDCFERAPGNIKSAQNESSLLPIQLVV